MQAEPGRVLMTVENEVRRERIRRQMEESGNDYMLRNHANANMFATTFFGVFDPTNGQLNYINGGHNQPVVLGPEGIKDRLIAPFAESAVDLLDRIDNALQEHIGTADQFDDITMLVARRVAE